MATISKRTTPWLAFMTPYENDSVTTEEAFTPTFNDFASSNVHLANVTTEGVEPYFIFPFYYFVNEDGIYRICDQEFSVQGSLLFSYPVGKQELVAGWNGEIGEFGELNVQQLEGAISSGEFHERDEAFNTSCTALLEGNSKKRIKVKWVSNAWKVLNIPDPYTGQPSSVHVYIWSHEATIKAQKKSLGIWWRDKRHISLSMDGDFTNRHTHPDINYSERYDASYFQCFRENELKASASNAIFSSINSNLNNFALDLTVVGTNRQTDCQTIQATCTLVLLND